MGRSIKNNLNHKFKLMVEGRDGNKTVTHLQPAKSTPFKTQMGGERGF